MRDEIQVFTGNSNRPLAAEVCRSSDVALGHAEVRRFSDGEVMVEIAENVRGGDVFVIQSTCTPVNDHLMELLLMLDAFRRASAKRITAVIPYYGYARQDRKVSPRVPISAKLVADLITTAGASRVLTIDLHAGQIQGFFDIPVDNLFATPVLLKEMQERVAQRPGRRRVARSRAASSARARLRSGWMRRWRSSTSAARAPTKSPRCASSATSRADRRDRRRHRRHGRNARRPPPRRCAKPAPRKWSRAARIRCSRARRSNAFSESTLTSWS